MKLETKNKELILMKDQKGEVRQLEAKITLLEGQLDKYENQNRGMVREVGGDIKASLSPQEQVQI